MRLREVLEELLAVLAPPLCAVCREAVASASEAMCPACRRALPWLPEPLCRRCALPVPCRPCPADRAPWEAAWSPFAHSASARLAVIRLKFAGALALADAMAAPMAANAPVALLTQATLVPVPMPAARRRARGFNQAECLAAALARRLNLPLARCLARHGEATRQLGAGRSARLTGARLEVTVCGAVPERAVLVDDVHTTGATFAACARALRAGGARSVSCLAYARALPA